MCACESIGVCTCACVFVLVQYCDSEWVHKRGSYPGPTNDLKITFKIM